MSSLKHSNENFHQNNFVNALWNSSPFKGNKWLCLLALFDPAIEKLTTDVWDSSSSLNLGEVKAYFDVDFQICMQSCIWIWIYYSWSETNILFFIGIFFF